MNALRSRLFTPRGRGHAPTQPWRPHSLWTFRIALALIVVGLLTYLSPYQRPYNVAQLRVGGTAQEPIRAPFLYHVPKRDAELEQPR